MTLIDLFKGKSERWIRVYDFVRRRTRNYQYTFGPAHGLAVLKDLAKFCRANETCVVPDNDRLSAVLEGRREVWLRIQQHLHLEPDQLTDILFGPNKE